MAPPARWRWIPGNGDAAGLACLNAGVIADAQGSPREARTRYLEAIGSFVRSRNSAHAMMAYNNLGSASVDLWEWIDAEVYFSRGIEIGERLSHSPMVARLYCNRAHATHQRGERSSALSRHTAIIFAKGSDFLAGTLD